MSLYTNVLGSFQFCEVFLFAPIVGLIVDSSQNLLTKWNPQMNEKIIRLKANVLSLSLVAFFGVLAPVMQSIPVLEVQPISIISMCFFRAFLMGATANFLNLAFPVKHFGKLYGITRLMGGLATFLSGSWFNFLSTVHWNFLGLHGPCNMVKKVFITLLWIIEPQLRTDIQRRSGCWK